MVEEPVDAAKVPFDEERRRLAAGERPDDTLDLGRARVAHLVERRVKVDEEVRLERCRGRRRRHRRDDARQGLGELERRGAEAHVRAAPGTTTARAGTAAAAVAIEAAARAHRGRGVLERRARLEEGGLCRWVGRVEADARGEDAVLERDGCVLRLRAGNDGRSQPPARSVRVSSRGREHARPSTRPRPLDPPSRPDPLPSCPPARPARLPAAPRPPLPHRHPNPARSAETGQSWAAASGGSARRGRGGARATRAPRCARSRAGGRRRWRAGRRPRRTRRDGRALQGGRVS